MSDEAVPDNAVPAIYEAVRHRMAEVSESALRPLADWATSVVLDHLRTLPVEQRMSAMGMHPILLDTTAPLTGGIPALVTPDGVGLGTIHFSKTRTTVWLENPSGEALGEQ